MALGTAATKPVEAREIVRGCVVSREKNSMIWHAMPCHAKSDSIVESSLKIQRRSQREYLMNHVLMTYEIRAQKTFFGLS